jgi:F-type H+-transporting ATPase subunit delta
VNVGPVAARYANALFELALEKGALERVKADVEQIDRDVARDAKLFDARTSQASVHARVEALAPKLDPLTANFVRLLRDKRRIDVLRELAAAFKRCLLAHENAVEGVVESARPLGSGEEAELAVALGALLGKRVELKTNVAPELIAGVRVIVDNRLIDQSAQGRLDALRAKLMRARVTSN